MLSPAALDELFVALLALKRRELERGARSSKDALHWQLVESAIEALCPGDDDVRQETIMAVFRGIGSMEAVAPLQAVAWIRMIHRHKAVDALRRRKHDVVTRAMRGAGEIELDALPGEVPARAVDETAALDEARNTIFAAIDEAAEAVPSEASRALRRAQGRAAYLRLVSELDVDAVERALGWPEPLGKDRLYKWIERGRILVREAADAWERTTGEEVAPLAEIVRAAVDTRRADAGRARPRRGET